MYDLKNNFLQLLYSRKFSDGNIFGQSRVSTFRTDYIFVHCCMLNARVLMRYACIHNFTGTNFSTELILVQKRQCTKSYENKFCPKISCYTVSFKCWQWGCSIPKDALARLHTDWTCGDQESWRSRITPRCLCSLTTLIGVLFRPGKYRS